MIVKTKNNRVICSCEIESISNNNKCLLMGVDSNAQKTIYIREVFTLNKGKNTIDFSLPLSPQNLEIKILADNTAVLRECNIKPLALPKTIYINKNNERMQDFPLFVEVLSDFCKKASYLKEGIYSSPNEEVNWQYIDIIPDERGRPLVTPARTIIDSGNMQIAKSMFVTYSVPMRMFIVLHERSHYIFDFTGGDLESESFADNFAKQIYEALGFPTSVYNQLLGTALKENTANFQRVQNLKR